MDSILLVDDDPNILKGYKRNLRSKYDVVTAGSAHEALEILRKGRRFVVIISDYSMPGTNGVEFLKLASRINKDSVRILLTGFANLEMAIEAVNKGNIFRFLTKPCPMELLFQTTQQAVAQHRLIMAERVLLHKTLKGVVVILSQILQTTNPISFNHAQRMATLGKNVAARIKRESAWELEVCCLLSQIGCVSIPQNIIEKRMHSLELEKREFEIFMTHCNLGGKLLANIPRFENISKSIFNQYTGFYKNEPEESPGIEELPFTGKMLQLLNDYFLLQSEGKDNEAILKVLFENQHYYDAELLNGLAAELRGATEGTVLAVYNIEDLHPGLFIAKDTYDNNGRLLLPKHTELNDISIAKLVSYLKVEKIAPEIEVFEITR